MPVWGGYICGTRVVASLRARRPATLPHVLAAYADRVADARSGIALVHEWLASRAGSEKTFEQMTQVLPDADVFALTIDRSAGFEIAAPVRVTLLQQIPVLRERRALALPLMPLAWRALRTARYRTVITSSHAFARYMPAARDAAHLSYVYTPLRYAWLPEVDGRSANRALAPARASLRALDRRTVRHVDSFAAISNAVRRRIADFYERDAAVIFPPVDTDFFSCPPDRDDSNRRATEPFVLGVSRWIPYKKLDVVIAAADRLGLPVVIAGHGPGEAALRSAADRARVPVTFERRPGNDRLRRLYREAAVLAFPAEEDFGIIPVEAQAAGTPVVAYRRGGSLDTVLDGVTGVLVDTQDVDDVASGIAAALALTSPREAFQDHVAQFSVREFRRSFGDWVAPWVST